MLHRCVFGGDLAVRANQTSWILPRTWVSGQTGLNMNPLGTNRPRSVDPDGSQPAVPKIDLENSGYLDVEKR